VEGVPHRRLPSDVPAVCEVHCVGVDGVSADSCNP